VNVSASSRTGAAGGYSSNDLDQKERIVNARHAVADVPELGELTLVADGASVTGIYFPGHWTLPDPESFGRRIELSDDPLLAEAATQLRDFACGRRETFDLPTATAGDPFQERVWARLREIPFGETTTYGEIALELGDPGLARRVGQAVGANPLSIVVPCHRVVG
jgi:methylated-DNA-[protein]-cysteine S-methyltransferase